jgi:hypothetical protein
VGGRAIWRAVTRVKPEQASKVKMRTPTRLSNGEGRVGRGSNRRAHPSRSAGVVGTARQKGDPGNRGRPVPVGGRASDVAIGGGPGGSRTGL